LIAVPLVFVPAAPVAPAGPVLPVSPVTPLQAASNISAVPAASLPIQSPTFEARCIVLSFPEIPEGQYIHAVTREPTRASREGLFDSAQRRGAGLA